MQIFITGISSEIGKSIAQKSIANGHRVFGLSRKKDFRIEGCHIISGDLELPDSYKKHLPFTDLLVHAAGITHSNRIERYFAVNSRAGDRLISLAERFQIKRVAYISTRAIGPGCGAYGASKRVLEKRLAKSQMKWIIFRVAEVYGIVKSEGINALMQQVLCKKIIPIPGNGEFELTPIHVADVANAVVTASEDPDICQKVYTLCGPRSYAIKEFVSVMCRIAGLERVGILIPIPVIRVAAILQQFFPVPFRVRRDQIQRLAVRKEKDFSEARRDFGFAPIDFESWFQNIVKTNWGFKTAPHGRKGKHRFVEGLPRVILFPL